MPGASRNIEFGHAEHCMKNICLKYIIYQAIRKMVMRIIMDSGEDNTFLSGTALKLGLILVSFIALHFTSRASHQMYFSKKDQNFIPVKLQRCQWVVMAIECVLLFCCKVSDWSITIISLVCCLHFSRPKKTTLNKNKVSFSLEKV